MNDECTIKSKINLSCTYVTVVNLDFPIRLFSMLAHKDFEIIWLFILLSQSIADESYSTNTQLALN